MELKSTNSITILSRNLSNSSVEQLEDVKRIEDKLCVQNDGNKIIANDDFTDHVSEIVDNRTKSKGDIVKSEDENVLDVRGDVRSSTFKESESNCKIIKVTEYLHSSHSILHDTLPQNNKEDVKPVKILQKPNSTRNVSTEARDDPEFLDDNKDIEMNTIDACRDVQDAVNTNSAEELDDTVPAVENENVTPLNETLGPPPKSITILKQPPETVGGFVSKPSVESNEESLVPHSDTMDERQDREQIEETSEKQIEDAKEVEDIDEAIVEEENEVRMQNVTILKRPGSHHLLENKAGGPDSSSHHALENKSGQSIKTFSQRQKEYNEARLRIFGILNIENNSDDENEGNADLEADNDSTPATPVKKISPEHKGDFYYIDVDSYQAIDQPSVPNKLDRSPPESYKPSTPVIYSNGSQHPLQYFNQSVPNRSQPMYYYPQCDYATLYNQSSYGGTPHLNYIPHGLNFIGPDGVPNFPGTPLDFFSQNFSSYEQMAPNWLPNYLGCDSFAYYSEASDYGQGFVADSNYFSCPDPSYTDIDYMHQKPCYYDGHYVESAQV